VTETIIEANNGMQQVQCVFIQTLASFAGTGTSVFILEEGTKQRFFLPRMLQDFGEIAAI